MSPERPTSERPTSFAAFWPYYLMAHRDPRCRALHYVGSSGGIAGTIAAIATLNPLWLVVGLVFAYGLAWIGHFFVEGNRPATFGNPAWSLIGDLRMYSLWLSGRLAPALAAAEDRLTRAPGSDRTANGFSEAPLKTR